MELRKNFLANILGGGGGGGVIPVITSNGGGATATIGVLTSDTFVTNVTATGTALNRCLLDRAAASGVDNGVTWGSGSAATVVFTDCLIKGEGSVRPGSKAYISLSGTLVPTMVNTTQSGFASLT